MLQDKPVFMKLDPVISAILAHLDREYEENTQQDGSTIVKLEKALYGCVQSAALWYYDLKKTFESNMFVCNPYVVCVFSKTEEGVQTIVLFNVDNLMASSIKDECLTRLYNILVSKYGKVTITRGLDHSYLGMRYQLYHHDQTVNISMSGYISDTISQSGLIGKSARPANEDIFMIKESPL